MNPTPGAIGREAEECARTYLASQGLKFVQANYRCRRGEIDLVMQEGSILVFVEVRYRRTSRYGSGAETVTAEKRRRIISAAQHYLLSHPRFSGPCRFDVISLSFKEERPHVEWIPNAFMVS